MGNDVDREMGRSILGRANLVHGQRDPVERDRAFGSYHRRELAGDADSDARRIAFGTSADDFGHGVDMAGDDMAAELVAKPQGPLEVELSPLAPTVGGGLGDRLSG